MKELRFTSQNFVDTGDSNCVLPPDDPLYQYLRTNDSSVFDKPKTMSVTQQFEDHRRKLEIARAQGIKPGSPAWNLL